MAQSDINQCQHYYTLEILPPLGALGLKAFNQLFEISGKLCVSPSCSSSPSSIQVSEEHITGNSDFL